MHLDGEKKKNEDEKKEKQKERKNEDEKKERKRKREREIYFVPITRELDLMTMPPATSCPVLQER
jgi:hypothetical protein